MLEILLVALIGVNALMFLNLNKSVGALRVLKNEFDTLENAVEVSVIRLDQRLKGVETNLMSVAESCEELDERTDGIDFVRDYLVDQITPEDAYRVPKANIVKFEMVKGDKDV